METLTLRESLELYDILGKYIPKVEDENNDALEFIGKIIDNVNTSGHHEDYINAIVLMSGRDWDEIKLLQSSDILDLFIEGLSVNQIVKLKSFFDMIGFAHA